MSELLSSPGQGRIILRSKSKLNQRFRKSNTGQNGLSYLGPKIRNSLHFDVKSAKNVNSFKHEIKEKFFNDLQSQENSPHVLSSRFLKAATELLINNLENAALLSTF